MPSMEFNENENHPFRQIRIIVKDDSAKEITVRPAGAATQFALDIQRHFQSYPEPESSLILPTFPAGD